MRYATLATEMQMQCVQTGPGAEPGIPNVEGLLLSSYFTSFLPFLFLNSSASFSPFLLAHFRFSPHLTFSTSRHFFLLRRLVWDRGTRVGACFGLFCFLVWSGVLAISFCLGKVEVEASHVCGLLGGHQGAVMAFGVPACLSCLAMLHSLRFQNVIARALVFLSSCLVILVDINDGNDDLFDIACIDCVG
ncbi:hypothetical protein BDW68DRAFT_115467 [Aspergillus falconensis]